MSFKEYLETFSINELPEVSYRSTILYGKDGVRKTTTAARLVKNKGLLISADNSYDVLFKDGHKNLADKIKIMFYKDRRQLENIPNLEQYDTIILDTFSAMVEQFLDMMFENSSWGKTQTGDEKYREALTSSTHDDLRTTTTGPIDYKVLRDKWRPTVNHLIKQPINIIWVCHESGITSDIKKNRRALDDAYNPSLPEQTMKLITRPSSIIGFIEGGGGKKLTVNTDESDNYCVSKSRVSGISGKQPIDTFVSAYHKAVFGESND